MGKIAGIIGAGFAWVGLALMAPGFVIFWLGVQVAEIEERP